MNTYKINFTGRTNGSIGKTYPIAETVKAENEENATIKLYDKYEHIDVYQITKEN